MHIRHRLQINSAGIAVLALAVALVFCVTLSRVNQALEASELSDALSLSSYERLLLRTDSQRTGSERTTVQLIAKHREVEKLLQKALEKFPSPEDQQTIRELFSKHESIGYLSRTLRLNRQRGPASDGSAPLFLETQNLLESQLNTRVYESVLLQSKLQKSAETALRSSVNQAAEGILLVLAMVTALVLVNSVLLNRLFAARIRTMRQGTAMVGGGDLSHRIEVTGADEFSELAQSFNDMTGRLRASYRHLEQEFEGRKQVEQALRESENRFSLAQELSPDGFTILRPMRDLSGEIIDFTWIYENAAIARMNGTDPAAVVGRRLLEVIPSHIDSPFHEVYRRAAESGEPEVLEAPFQTETMAEQKWFRVAVVPTGEDLAVLAHDITNKKRAEQQLKASLREKEVLLKEIHHRVKNNLQVISSLVSLQAGESPDQSVREVLREVSYRVRSMALVHEKLYQSADLAHVNFAEYLESLLTFIWRSHGSAAAQVRLNLELEPVSFPVDTAVPCGLILNELAANTLKHAFAGRDSGEVTVSLRQREDGAVVLRVADDGVGLPPGLDWRNARSLGLRLVQMLAGQLDARVEVSAGPGTCFEVTLPGRKAAGDDELSKGASR